MCTAAQIDGFTAARQISDSISGRSVRASRAAAAADGPDVRQDGREGASTRLFVLTQIDSAPDGNRAIGDVGGKTSGHHTGLPAVHGRDDSGARPGNALSVRVTRASARPLPALSGAASRSLRSRPAPATRTRAGRPVDATGAQPKGPSRPSLPAASPPGCSQPRSQLHTSAANSGPQPVMMAPSAVYSTPSASGPYSSWLKCEQVISPPPTRQVS